MTASRLTQHLMMPVSRNHLVLQTNRRADTKPSCRIATIWANLSPQRRISLIKLRKAADTKALLQMFW
jgi:hypothetical protein